MLYFSCTCTPLILLLLFNQENSLKNLFFFSFQQCGMSDKQSLRSACTYAQSDQSLCLSLEYYMSVKLLTEHHHLEFLSLTGGYSGLSESTLVKMPHCWKSHVATHYYVIMSPHQRGEGQLLFLVPIPPGLALVMPGIGVSMSLFCVQDNL